MATSGSSVIGNLKRQKWSIYKVLLDDRKSPAHYIIVPAFMPDKCLVLDLRSEPPM